MVKIEIQIFIRGLSYQPFGLLGQHERLVRVILESKRKYYMAGHHVEESEGYVYIHNMFQHAVEPAARRLRPTGTPVNTLSKGLCRVSLGSLYGFFRDNLGFLQALCRV